MYSLLYRAISVRAIDGESTEGNEAVITVTFDRTCSVWRDENGYPLRELSVPSALRDYERLGLCTAVTVERLEILNSPDITDLVFMGNITVSSMRTRVLAAN